MGLKELFPAFAQDDFLLLHSVNFHVKDGHQPKISDRPISLNLDGPFHAVARRAKVILAACAARCVAGKSRCPEPGKIGKVA